MTPRLREVLQGLTLEQACQLTIDRITELEKSNQPIPRQLRSLSNYLYWQHRYYTGTAIGDFTPFEE